MICKLFYMYTVIEDHHKWSYMLSVFPLSLKLSTSISSMYVFKRSLGTSLTRQGQHSIRSPSDVGPRIGFCCNKM